MKTVKFPIEIGMTVYLEPTGNAKGYHEKGALLCGNVSKIGKKYFYVTASRAWGEEAKFDKETFRCWDGNNNYGYNVYLTPEDYEREQTRQTQLQEIRDLAGRYRDELPADVVQAMYEPLANWLSRKGV